MDDAAGGQLKGDAAQIYETFFVPALFHEPAALTVRIVGLVPGQAVLDVACGTGVLAREASARVAPGGRVTGLDRNDAMLAVARAKAPGITWRRGLAEQLPFPDGSFDAGFCQFGLMFFEDRPAALSALWRVVRPGGVLAVSVWDSLERTPGYAAMTALLDRLFGARVADALRAPFLLGDPARLEGLAAEAGIGGAAIQALDVTARFPSLDAWVHTDVKGWTLADLIDDRQLATLLAAAQDELRAYVQADGTVAFASPALLLTARKA